jgi:hypothetical protein
MPLKPDDFPRNPFDGSIVLRALMKAWWDSVPNDDKAQTEPYVAKIVPTTAFWPIERMRQEILEGWIYGDFLGEWLAAIKHPDALEEREAQFQDGDYEGLRDRLTKILQAIELPEEVLVTTFEECGWICEAADACGWTAIKEAALGHQEHEDLDTDEPRHQAFMMAWHVATACGVKVFVDGGDYRAVKSRVQKSLLQVVDALIALEQ